MNKIPVFFFFFNFLIDTIGFNIYGVWFMIIIFFIIKLRYQLIFFFFCMWDLNLSLLFDNKKFYQFNQLELTPVSVA